MSAKHAQSRVRTLLLVVCIVSGLIAVCLISFSVASYLQLQKAEDRLVETGTPSAPTDEGLVNNPIDFSSLKADNGDIYAWIYIPETNISYPVLQSTYSDYYYIDHNVDYQASFEGAIYTESCNKTDFSDPVTLIYGHNLLNNTMFSELHLFEDADFFAANSVFYIYTPQHIYTYTIVAAYEYDNRHILNSFNFSHKDELASYFESVLSPSSLVSNVREGETLTTSDRIVQLSTCLKSGLSTKRYIVTGKLTNDQRTN